MIKITRFFYINLLCVPLFIITYITGGIYTLLCAYCIAFVHEIFHMLAAIALNVKVNCIILMPFGVTLRLKNNIIRNPEKEILVAIAGPFANALMIISAYAAGRYFGYNNLSFYFFIYVNAIMFFLNLLPCMPLDGGRILRGMLVSRIGYVRTAAYQKRISAFVIIFLVAVGLAILYITKFNVSLMVVAAFLILSMFDENRQSDYVVMNEIMHSKDKLKKGHIMNVKHIAADENTKAGEVLKRFGYDSLYMVTVSGKKPALKRTFTENEIIDFIENEGYGAKVGEMVSL